MPRQIFLPTEAIAAAFDAVDQRVAYEDVKVILRAADPHLGWQNAGRSTVWATEELLGAKTLVEQATAVNHLGNATSDLASWLHGYDERTGEVRDPNAPDDENGDEPYPAKTPGAPE